MYCPARKSTPLTGYIPSPPHANAIHVHQPARQPQVNHVVSLDVTARKTMQPLEPVWLVADSNYKASLGRKRMRDDVEWLSVPFMSTSRMGFANSAGAPRMVDEVKARIKPGLKFRLEGENESDDEIEIDEIPGPGEEATSASLSLYRHSRLTFVFQVTAQSSSQIPSDCAQDSTYDGLCSRLI
jgi:hypothetical protein